MKESYFLILLIILIKFSNGQEIKQEKAETIFGNVSPSDFDIKKYKVDTSSGAIIISDIGSSHFIGNNHGWFSIIFKKTRRVLIINNKGHDLTNVSIPLYILDLENNEQLVHLDASTYNLENDKIIKTDLSKTEIFSENIEPNILNKKFTFPNVKNGSILEYSYETNSDFINNLQDWEFQGIFPRVWSEYSVEFPNIFIYTISHQGMLPFYYTIDSTYRKEFGVVVKSNMLADPDFVRINTIINNHKWIMKNVPPIRDESFISTNKNYNSKIEFELFSEKIPNQPEVNIIGDWKSFNKTLLDKENFGGNLFRSNSWMEDLIKLLKLKSNSQLSLAQNIYSYLQENFKTHPSNNIFLKQGLKDCFKNKTGTDNEVNLLLVAMMYQIKLESNPVILSTKDNGILINTYPIESKFNKVLCQTIIDGKSYLLDASNPYLSFGQLSPIYYNGLSKIIKKDIQDLILSPDSIKDKSLINVLLSFNKKNENWNGVYQEDLGDYESLNIRQEIGENNQNIVLNKIKNENQGTIQFDSLSIHNLKDLSLGIEIKAELNSNQFKKNEKIIYVSPILKPFIKENPFKSTIRIYPIEMPFKRDGTYNFQLEIPEGYYVDELPESVRVNLNDKDGYFEYLIESKENRINIRSRFKLNKSTFPISDYESLKSFYDIILKKQSERIILKKL